MSCVRDKTGRALIGARQWIPREHIEDPVRSLVMGLPLDLQFRTKGQLAIDVCAAAYADGIRFDFTCGDEVYGSCTQLREFFEARGQAYVLRVPSNFALTLAAGTKMTCAQAVKALLKDKRRWEIRSAGNGSKGERWYAWAWLATASPRHHLLVRRHLKTGDLAFHYCWVPEGQVLTKDRLIRAAGLRWPVVVRKRSKRARTCSAGSRPRPGAGTASAATPPWPPSPSSGPPPSATRSPATSSSPAPGTPPATPRTTAKSATLTC